MNHVLFLGRGVLFWLFYSSHITLMLSLFFCVPHLHTTLCQALVFPPSPCLPAKSLSSRHALVFPPSPCLPAMPLSSRHALVFPPSSCLPAKPLSSRQALIFPPSPCLPATWSIISTTIRTTVDRMAPLSFHLLLNPHGIM